jgi:glutathione S-transferase
MRHLRFADGDGRAARDPNASVSTADHKPRRFLANADPYSPMKQPRGNRLRTTHQDGPHKMILYQHPLSPYAQKIRIALREKGLSFDAKPWPIAGPDAPPILVNPRVELPTLDDGGVVIFDSTIILEYLEDRFPDPPLLPPGAAACAKVRMIEEVCDTHYEAINWGLGELRFFERAPGALGEKLRRRAGEQIRDLHCWLAKQTG